MPNTITPIASPTHANTRAYLQNWVDTLAAVGWVRSDAAAQVDIATATTSAGYVGAMFFESTDALSLERPIYLRVAFSNQTHGTFLRCQPTSIGFGLSLDKVAGIMDSATALYLSMCGTSSSYPATSGAGFQSAIFASSSNDGSLRLCDQPEAFAYNVSENNRGVHPAAFVVMARTKDENGNPTADGILICAPDNAWNSTVRAMAMSLIKPSGVIYSKSRGLCPFMTERTATSVELAAVGQVASADGLPQLQHPWACTPRLYPFEDVAMLSSFSAAAVGDILTVQVGAAVRKYLFLGRTGTPPSTVGSWAGNTTDYLVSKDMLIEAGIAILWE